MISGSSENGFSLIEVVVALGILSTTAISLSMIGSQSIDGVKQVEARYLARTVAEAQMAAVFTQAEPLEIGVERGQAMQLGQNFDWERVIEQSGRAGLLFVQVDVTAADDDTVLARIDTLKRPRR
jgi:type II secretion system protein I